MDDYMKLFADQRMMQEVAEFIAQSIDVSICVYHLAGKSGGKLN